MQNIYIITDIKTKALKREYILNFVYQISVSSNKKVNMRMRKIATPPFLLMDQTGVGENPIIQ